MSVFAEIQVRRIFRVVNGGTPTSDEENWNGDVPWATPVDLAAANGQLLSTTARTLTRDGLRNGSSSVPAGSLVLSTRAPIGYVAETTCEMAFNQGCRGLVPLKQLDTRYYRYLFTALRHQLDARGLGTTFRELSSDSLASTRIATPSFESQREISDFLDVETQRIDMLVSSLGGSPTSPTKSLCGLLLERRHAVISAVVTGELDVVEAAA
jgi:type I restriction enzyme S subunit